MQRNKHFLTISYLVFATSSLHAAHGSQSAAAQDFRAYDQGGFRMVSFNRSPNTPGLVFDPFQKIEGEAIVFLSRDLGSKPLKAAGGARLAQILGWIACAQSEPASLEPALNNFNQETFLLLRHKKGATKENLSKAVEQVALFDLLTWVKENHDKLKPLCDELETWSDQAQFVRNTGFKHYFSRTQRSDEENILPFNAIPENLRSDADQGYLACAKFQSLMKTYGYNSMLRVSGAPEHWKTREKPLNTPFTMIDTLTDTLAIFGNEEETRETSFHLLAAFLAAAQLRNATETGDEESCKTQ